MAMRGSVSLTAEIILCQYGTKMHVQLHKLLLSTTITVVNNNAVFLLCIVHFLKRGLLFWRERQRRRENRPTFSLSILNIEVPIRIILAIVMYYV